MSEEITGELILHDLADALEALDFVQWDRFTSGEYSDDLDFVEVYGWIDRPDDYKDFVVVTQYSNGHRNFTTSSSEHTEAIFQQLFDEPLDEHNDCKRVENYVDIPNMVEL